MPTRFLLVLVYTCLCGIAAAQTCIYSWGTDPGASSPQPSDPFFVDTQPPHNQPIRRLQFSVPASVFQNVPTLIRDVSFGVRQGARWMRFDEFTVRMGHTTASPLNTTFAQNITSPLTDVLVLRDHVWQQGFGPQWVPLGLQVPFLFLPGQGDLLVEIVTRNHTIVSSLAFDRFAGSSVGSCLIGSATTSVATVGAGLATIPALRFCVDRAETMLLGQTCAGSGNSTPLLGIAGRPTPGATPTIWLSDAPANAIAACAYGFDNAPPFPLDLTAVGAPGCRQYFSPAFADVVLANGVGVGQRTILIPNAASTIGAILYTQYYVLDPPANALDLTASNYARLLVGL